MTRHMLWVLGALLTAPTLASAQTACAGGQTVSPDTAGHCCWPGQAWSRGRGACVGVPGCPPGLMVMGEGCGPAGAPGGGFNASVSIGGTPQYAPSPPPPVQYVPQYAPQQYVQGQYAAAQYAPPPPVGVMGVMQGTVRVTFVPAREGDDFTVSAMTPGGPQVCQAPCALQLPPGPNQISIHGAKDFDSELVVPQVPVSVRIERFRTGGLVWGIVGLAVGVPIALIGLELLLVGGATSCDYYGSCSSDSSVTTIGGVLTAAGLALAIAGPSTGFTTMGHNRLEITSDFRASRSPSFQLAGLGAAPIHGGAGLGATFTF